LKIRAIALDDEPLALKVLENFSGKTNDIVLEKTFTNSVKALEYMATHPIDLIFIDIQMPSTLGTDLVREIDADIMVVFTTAYSEYAVEGFDLNAVDYLLKPFTQERFEQCVVKIKDHQKIKQTEQSETSISFKTDYSTVPLQLSDIRYIEGYDDYLKIHTSKSSPLVVRMTFKVLMTKLPANEFIRIHKSYVVSKRFVSKFNLNKVELGEDVLPVGPMYKENLKSLE
jgi:DNA-binding LytR/AlgR family response regulator